MPGSTFSKLLLVLPFSLSLFAQQQPGGVSAAKFVLRASDSSYQLPADFVIANSEELRVDSVRVLIRDIDYRIEYRTARVTLNLDRFESFLADTVIHILEVRFQPRPASIQTGYALRTLVKREAAGRGQTPSGLPPPRFTSPASSVPDLQKSGFISRGFQLGSNRDLTLNSGFRMQFAGKLSEDLDIVAALTDQNTPIQPEGNTQLLREVDQVFIELNSTRSSLTLGDFYFNTDRVGGGEFGRLSRKLQGARGTSKVSELPHSGDFSELSVVGASARGKFTTNQFHGAEGNQGPYRLQGKNGEQRPIIIAGTERVYVDGEQMQRGENNDYTIDYAGGEITFTARRLITNASRIVVDFEYSDREFTRNLVAAAASGIGVPGTVTVNVSFAQEADDPEAPIELELNDSLRAIISASGNDRLRASVPGLRFLGIDSTGKGRGQYLLKDTLLNGIARTILEFAPGDSLAFYAATFSAVTQVPPDSAGYFRVGAGKFVFAGLGQGNYLPLLLLPVPELHRQFDVNGSIAFTDALSFSGEFSGSSLNRNRLAAAGLSETDGGASRWTLTLNPKNFHVLGAIIGNLDLTATQRIVQRDFIALDRANEVEFSRTWNLQSAQSSDETIRELKASIAFPRVLRSGVQYGTLERPGDQSSARFAVEVGAHDSTSGEVFLRDEEISATYAASNSKSDWSRTLGTISGEVGGVGTVLRVERETRTAYHVGEDSLQPGSFRYLELAPKLAYTHSNSLSASAELQIRSEDSAAGGAMGNAFLAVTQLYALQVSDGSAFTSSALLNIRNTEFSDAFKRRGSSSANVVTVRSQTHFTALQRSVESDVFYEFTSQRSARLERVFIRVARGTGNYQYIGDANNNGIAEENEFQLVRFDGDFILVSLPSDQLYPVVDVKTSMRFRVQPSRLISGASTAWEKFLTSLSAETYARVDERSTEPDIQQIYLLNFDRFQDDRTTVAGSSQWQQDLHLFENNPELSFRLRAAERRGFTQLVTAAERNYSQEKSLRVRSQLVREISNETNLIGKVDRVTASVQTNRERDLLGVTFNSSFAYRPDYRTEVGFDFGFADIVDRFSSPNTEAGINEQGLRVLYSFPGIGQLRSEIRREEVLLENLATTVSRPIPFELTNGKAPGQSYLWSLNFDYRMTSSIQLTLNYSGRSEGGRDPIHTARAEAKALF